MLYIPRVGYSLYRSVSRRKQILSSYREDWPKGLLSAFFPAFDQLIIIDGLTFGLLIGQFGFW